MQISFLLTIQIALRCSFVLPGEHYMEDYCFLSGLVTKLWRPFSNPARLLPPCCCYCGYSHAPVQTGPKSTAACRAVLHGFEGRQHLQTRVWKDTEINTMCEHHGGERTRLRRISSNQQEKALNYLTAQTGDYIQ